MAGGLWTSMYLSKGPKWPAEQSKPEAGHNRVRPLVILGPISHFSKRVFIQFPHITKSGAFAPDLAYWWEEMDSNHRS